MLQNQSLSVTISLLDQNHYIRIALQTHFYHSPSYITRFNVKDSSRHVILGTQQFKPSEFAAQINLSMDNAWGVVRCIVDLVKAQKEGKYLIVKDPNKPVIRLYDIPDNTFESEEDTDEESDGKFILGLPSSE